VMSDEDERERKERVVVMNDLTFFNKKINFWKNA
jgi:hypothetical protein